MLRITVLFCLILGVAAGCGDDSGEPASEHGDHDHDAELSDAVANYADIVLASYEDSLAKAVELDDAIHDFLDDPSEAKLDVARNAWRDAREPYLQTEVYRFYDGPIDNADDGVEGFVNAWPLDENFIDYTVDDDSAGIINDPDIALDVDALLAANEMGGEKNIATGYHAIEFLLWGQDLSEDGPGERPYTDFVAGDDGTAANQDRRAEYLHIVSALLVENLQTLVDAWKEDEDNYRADFEALPPEEALDHILTGMIVLSGFETGGERVQAALTTGDQEDEHSCFSDNTHRDMVQDVRGIRNVWKGEYERVDGSTVSGVSIEDVVAATGEALAERVSDRIDASLELAEAIEPPFDLEIAVGNDEGNTRVQALADSLQEQEDDLFDVFDAFGLEVEIPE